MIPMFFSSARMILSEFHESPAVELHIYTYIHTYTQVTTYAYYIHLMVHSHLSCICEPFLFLEPSRKSNRSDEAIYGWHYRSIQERGVHANTMICRDVSSMVIASMKNDVMFGSAFIIHKFGPVLCWKNRVDSTRLLCGFWCYFRSQIL